MDCETVNPEYSEQKVESAFPLVFQQLKYSDEVKSQLLAYSIIPLKQQQPLSSSSNQSTIVLSPKEQLRLVFQEMTNKISLKHFDDIFSTSDNSGAIVKNREQIVKTFKDDLYRGILDTFNDMWKDNDIEFQLNTLNFCKEKCQNSTTSWRPTGKTVEEQTKYLRVHYLKKKIKYIEEVLQLQVENFTSTCQEVEAKRAVIEDLIKRRDDISEQMDMRMAQINKVDSENISLQKDLCDR